jgi:hypothetical protein
VRLCATVQSVAGRCSEVTGKEHCGMRFSVTYGLPCEPGARLLVSKLLG